MRITAILVTLLMSGCALRQSMPCSIARDAGNILLEMTYRARPTTPVRSTVLVSTTGEVELNLNDRRRYCQTLSEADLALVERSVTALLTRDLRALSERPGGRDRGACFSLVLPGKAEQVAVLCGNADFDAIGSELSLIHDALIRVLGEPMREALEAVPALTP